MNNLYKKLNKESDHIRLTPGEKSAMRAAIFGAPSPVAVYKSSYVFLSHKWMTALAALLLVVFAGGSTAYAAQGALPGSPLYAVKTQVIEPVRVALAVSPAAKAAVNSQIAQARVEEAEALAERGSLDATISQALADNFESHARSAIAFAAQASSSDPAAAAEIEAQVNANAAVGGAVLAALAQRHGDDRRSAESLSARFLARANAAAQNQDERGGQRTLAVEPAASPVRTMALATAQVATSTPSSSATAPAQEAAVNPRSQALAAGLEGRAQSALDAARAQFLVASSTLDASTIVDVQNALGGIEALMQSGSAALGDSIFDTAAKDFAQALSQSLKLEALLSAQAHFDRDTIKPLFKLDFRAGSDSHEGSATSSEN